MTPDQSYSFLEPPTAEPGLPVAVRSAGRETRANRDYRWDNERHGRRRYDIFQISLSGSGYLERRARGGPVRERVGPGRMLIASWRREFAYGWDGGEPWEFLYITLSGAFADKVALSLSARGPVVDLPPRSAPATAVNGLLARLERLGGGRAGKLDRYALSAIGYEFLLLLLAAAAPGPGSEEELFAAEARQEVERDLRGASLAGLARHFGYGEKYFISYFAQRVGMTPGRFIAEARARRAEALLAGTRKSVAEIALECGYGEDGYFSKAFRRERGLSPSEYRERHARDFRAGELVVLG